MDESQQPIVADATHKARMFRLGARVSLYYVLLFSAIGVLVTTLPIGSTIWPVGGIDQLVAGPDLTVTDVTDALRDGGAASLDALTQPPAAVSRVGWVERMVALFAAMTGSLLLMLPVSWVYRSIHRNEVHDRSLDETTLVLPAVVAGIVVIVQHSLALAFSLAGIVAGVRFRRALTDTFDTLFILTAVGVGIAAGTRSMEIAIVVSVFFSYATLLVSAFGDGLESRYAAEHKRRRKAVKQAQRESEAAPGSEGD